VNKVHKLFIHFVELWPIVGMTIAIVRGNCGSEVIDKTWESERVCIVIHV